MASKIACKTNLTEIQKNNVADAFMHLLKGLKYVLGNAIQHAHNEKYPEGPERDEFRKEFWRNLFLDGKMLQKDSIDENGNITKKRDGIPEECPSNPYDKLDIQVLLKYLYYGGRRVLSGDWRDNTAVYCLDQKIFFDFFDIHCEYDKKRYLNAKDYSFCLNYLLALRNGCSHETKDFITNLVLSERMEEDSPEQPIHYYIGRYEAFLKPLCKKEWYGSNDAILLFNVVSTKIYDALGPIQYQLSDILKELNLFGNNKDSLKQLLVASGLMVDNDNLLYQGNIDELVSAIKIAWKANEVLSFDDGTNLLKKQVLVLKQSSDKHLNEFTKLIGMAEANKSSLRKEYDKLSFEDLQKEADKGDAEAQYHLGLCYLEGKGTVVSYDDALVYFRDSVNQGNSDAMVKIGEFYEQGNRFKLDFKQAFEWYKKAADANNSEGCYRVGLCYENQIGVNADRAEAYSYFKSAANKGHKNAEVAVGRCYLYGRYGIGKGVDRKKAKEIFERLAAEGIPSAKIGLGMYYESVDILKAVEYYENAIKEGNYEAFPRLELCRSQGRAPNSLDLHIELLGCSESKALSPKLYPELLKQNYPPEMYKEAEIQGGEEGERLLKQSADAGYIPAIWKLCDMYLEDETQNRDDLYKYYENAVQIDYPSAVWYFCLQEEHRNSPILRSQHLDKIVRCLKKPIPEVDYSERFRKVSLNIFKCGVKAAQRWVIEDCESGAFSACYPIFEEEEEETREAWICKMLIYASKCGNIWALNRLLGYYKRGYWCFIKKAQLLNLYQFVHDAETMITMGELYEHGIGDFEQDKTKALYKYNAAADCDNITGIIKTAEFFENGYGVEKNRLIALSFYEDAAELGDEKSKIIIEELKNSLSPEETENLSVRHQLRKKTIEQINLDYIYASWENQKQSN